MCSVRLSYFAGVTSRGRRMAHAVQWSAWARRTGIRNRNRYSFRDLVTRWTAPDVAAVVVRSARKARAVSGPVFRIPVRVAQATGTARHGVAYRGRAFASAPVVPGSRRHPNCQRAVRMHEHPAPGQQKAPVGLHAGRGFRFRETCGGAFFRGSPDRCPGDLRHELTVAGP